MFYKIVYSESHHTQLLGTRVILCSNKSGLMSQIIEYNDSVLSDFLQHYVHRIPIIGHGIHLCMLLVYILLWYCAFPFYLYTHYAIILHSAKPFSVKCSLPTNLQKFSPSKVSHYTVHMTPTHHYRYQGFI